MKCKPKFTVLIANDFVRSHKTVMFTKGLFILSVSCGKTLKPSQTLKVISINVSFYFNLNNKNVYA